MAEPRGCIKLEIDGSNYSSVVPVIGMYVAGTSLVCLLAMVYDIFSAIAHKKTWLPCKLFSMNSLTLTLLAIAAKLPVDLTTPMPSGLDQFSKLTGNGLICVSMGFLMPSLGLKSNHDSLTNMLASSVCVLTLVVNTCLQIRTGVIILFITEHIIIMCCLLSMLCPLWLCIGYMTIKKDFVLDHDKDLVREGKGSMLERLQLAYLYGFNHEPQLVITMYHPVILNVSGLCIICSVVVMKAATRNLSLKFCGGNSDYGWSVWVIVLVQILIVLVGSSATVFRSWVCRGWVQDVGSDKVRHPPLVDTFLPRSVMKQRKCADKAILILMLANPISITVWGLLLLNCFVSIASLLVRLTATAMSDAVSATLKQKEEIDVENYEKIVIDGGGMSLTSWGLLQSVKDAKRWMKMHKSQAMKNLADLLLKTQPSQPFHTLRAPQNFLLNGTLQVSSLSLVQLVAIAQYSLPSEFSAPLTQAYSEVMEIIYFIDDKMRSSRNMNKFQVRYAKAVWLEIFPKPNRIREPEESQFDRALTKLKSKARANKLWKETWLAMIKFVQDGYSRSTQHGPSDFMQQLFVDMLHIFLTQLPRALYKEVTQNTPEGFYERVKTSLGILWKIELLENSMQSSEAPIKWSFLEEFGTYDLEISHTELPELHLHANVPSHFDAGLGNVSSEHDADAIVVV